ncbi:hypothetical protein CBR_g52558 [Chara braunii]|uniref:Right handed beta helix domain-containing protein n=1 Tax=Chara braunii TaxID=69332 RepID=A0A388MAC8_CHABU|nr:hypothetical protein CBR_g52558 [Chara braunii]|eukprot:GBG91524.1 hypothetical protein CBR_g52558 [Chara braunii]
MAGGQATLRTRTACEPLVLLLLVLLSLDGYGGGVKAAAGGVAATEARRGLCTSTLTAEARLRAAMMNPNTTIVRLTSDIRLTSDLPYVTCPNLTVIGNCTTDCGQPRLCQIYGGERFGGFARAEERIILTLQNLLMSNFTLSKENASSVIAGGGTIVVKNCLFQNNTARGGGLFGAFMGTVTIENSTFIGNNGTVIDGMFGNVYLKDVVFRSNIGGVVIFLYRATVDGERCEFEANSGGAVSVSIGSLKFINSSFVNNSRGAVSAVAASATFCYCQFEGNYVISEDGGKREVEHVYFNRVMSYESRLLFCKQRPQVGVHLESPNLASFVKDSCEECPK